MIDFIKTYKPYLIFSSFIIIGLLIFALISQGFYPIATVNGKIITAHSFWERYQVGSAYLLNNPEEFTIDSSGKAINPPTDVDLKKMALTQLIEEVIIAEGAEEELGRDLEALVANRLEKIPKDENFKKTAESIYGASFNDVLADYLIPIAKQEILSGRLFLKGEDFNDWLLKAKTEAKVRIFSGEFYWNGVEIQISN